MYMNGRVNTLRKKGTMFLYHQFVLEKWNLDLTTKMICYHCVPRSKAPESMIQKKPLKPPDNIRGWSTLLSTSLKNRALRMNYFPLSTFDTWFLKHPFRSANSCCVNPNLFLTSRILLPRSNVCAATDTIYSEKIRFEIPYFVCLDFALLFRRLTVGWQSTTFSLISRHSVPFPSGIH